MSDASVEGRLAATTARFVRAVVAELRWRIAGSIAVALGLALTEGTGLLLLVPLLASIGLDVQSGPTGTLAETVSSAFALAGVRPTLPTVLLAFVAVSVSQALLYRTYLLLNPSLEQRFVVALRERLYAAIVSVDWSFFTRQRTSDLVHTVTTDVDRTGSAVYQLLTFFTGTVVTLMYVAIAFRLSPTLTLAVASAGLVVLWVSRRRGLRSNALGERYADMNRRQFQVLSESIAGLKVAKSFAAEPRHVAVFAQHARARTSAYMDLLRTFASAKFGLDLSSALVISTLLFVAVELLGIRGAGLLVLIFVFSRVMPRVMSLQDSLQVVLSGIPSFAAAARVLDACEAHAERPGDTRAPLALRREVRFDTVSYLYSGAASPAVEAVSLAIPAGRTIAIVGPSGAGKSTLADLLIGLLRPTDGRIVVDGRPLSAEDLAAWRAAIGYVPQDSFLLHDTVRANLLWAKPDATDAEMWSALQAAAAADFLRVGREGLDTVVGDRGVRLSGGERQRLALARALLRRPALLVLDEATSALDTPNEQQILSAVRGLGAAVTTVLVTHRLGAIRHADVIYVMVAGRVVESGSWDELSMAGGPFSTLLDAQVPHAFVGQRTRMSASAPSNPVVVR